MRFFLCKVITVTVLAVPQAVWGQSAPTTSNDFLQRGYGYYQQNDYDRAITDCTQALKLNPNNDRAYFLRGLSYYFKDDYDRGMVAAKCLTPKFGSVADQSETLSRACRKTINVA